MPALGARNADNHDRSWRFIKLGLCLLLGLGRSAGAVELPRPDEATDFLAPQSLIDAHPRWTTEHSRKSAHLADFLVWPAVTLGPVVDSNPFQRRRPGKPALGIALAPALLAERDSGVHRTTLYGAGDVQLFPQSGDADTVNGRAGVLHDWTLQRDVTVRIQGEITRRTDPFNTTQLLAPNARRALLEETDAIGAASVQKTFDHLFVVVSGTALRSTYDAPPDVRNQIGPRSLSSETVLTTRGRVGYLFPSTLYVFAEPGADRRTLDLLPHASTGTRAVAGVGVARFGLLGGEIFAGRQTQAYPMRSSSLTSLALGGRLAWSPTRAWTVAARYDESLGDVAVGTAADALGAPVRERTALLSIDCTLSPLWKARAEAGSIWIDYVGTRRNDQLIFADLRADYAISRSIDFTGLLRVTALRSSIPAAAYQRAAATLGATYHY